MDNLIWIIDGNDIDNNLEIAHKEFKIVLDEMKKIGLIHNKCHILLLIIKWI